MPKLIDLSGQRFGRLIAVKRVDNIGNNAAWLCKCDCGNDTIVRASYLRFGSTKSCGCARDEVMNRKKTIDLAGRKYGKLLVLKQAGYNGQGGALWLCKCDCGNEKVVDAHALRRGKTKSCGCLHKEKMTKMKTTHGLHKTRLYQVWNDMKFRCNSEKSHNYKNYGGRGIRVCEEWQNSYESFRTWALANGYDETAIRGICTLDRIDVNGNYEPGNCRWITTQEQQSNKRDTVFIEFGAERHTMKQWAEITGISVDAIRYRLKKGWPIERVLTEPLHEQNSHTNKKNG